MATPADVMGRQEVVQFLGGSHSTFDRLHRSGTFPRARYLSPRRPIWLRAEVEKWTKEHGGSIGRKDPSARPIVTPMRQPHQKGQPVQHDQYIKTSKGTLLASYGPRKDTGTGIEEVEPGSAEFWGVYRHGQAAGLSASAMRRMKTVPGPLPAWLPTSSASVATTAG